MTETEFSIGESGTKTVDETRLETDVSYRFNFLVDVTGLTEQDHELLREHHKTLEPHLSDIIASIYRKMFQYQSMKRHFLPRHTGFEGNVPAAINELKFDHAQTEFRKKKLEEYFVKLCTADWDDTFAALIDVVGHMHTPRQGNALLQIPMIQLSALMAVMNDLFLQKISELKLSPKTQLVLQRIYSKLFWIQNGMFIRHWTK